MPEHTSYYDNMNWNGGGWQNGCNWDVPSDIVNKAYYVIGDGFVCAACLDKYITPLQEKAEVRYIVALKEAQAENLSNRIKNDNLRKDKEVQKLKDKIQELQDEIDVKNGRKKPTTRHFIDSAKWLYHSDSTTLYLKGSLKWGTITVDTTTSLKLSK